MATTAIEKPGDFYAPAYRIVFYRPQKTTSVDDDGNVDAAADTGSIDVLKDDQSSRNEALLKSSFDDGSEATIMRAYVSSVTIEGISSSAYKATVVLTPPYAEAVKILEQKLIVFGSVMSIEWGYFNQGTEPIRSPKHLFRITQPSVQFGLTTTITIVGRDIFTAASEGRTTRRSWKREEYKTDLDVLEGVLKATGTSMFLDSDGIPPESELKQQGKTAGWEQTESEWRFFRRVCESNSVGWTTDGEDGDTVRLFDKQNVATKDVSYRLLWMTKPTGDFDIPVEEVSINPLLTLFQGLPETRGVRHSAPNPNTNVTTQTNKDDANQPTSQRPGAAPLTGTAGAAATGTVTNTGNASVNGDPKLNKDQTGTQVPTTSRENNPDKKIENMVTEGAQLANNRATVKIPGHPAIAPQMVVSLVGLPKGFGGNYLIRSLKHVIGAGYTTELDLFARASSSDPRGVGARTEGGTNKTVADPKSGDEPTAYGPDGKPVGSLF